MTMEEELQLFIYSFKPTAVWKKQELRENEELLNIKLS